MQHIQGLDFLCSRSINTLLLLLKVLQEVWFPVCIEAICKLSAPAESEPDEDNQASATISSEIPSPNRGEASNLKQVGHFF